jgi:hypothetical protein
MSRQNAQPMWLETQANVTACKYQFAGRNALILGIPANSSHFLITYTYRAHGKTFNDQFSSPTYLEQGSTFPVSYNPLSPQQNSKSRSSPAANSPLFAIALAGSVFLSVLYFASMRGCN